MDRPPAGHHLHERLAAPPVRADQDREVIAASRRDRDGEMKARARAIVPDRRHALIHAHVRIRELRPRRQHDRRIRERHRDAAAHLERCVAHRQPLGQIRIVRKLPIRAPDGEQPGHDLEPQ